MTAPFLLDEMSEESTCLAGPFHICRAADAPFDDAGWVFEAKYDGFRMVAKIIRKAVG